MLSTRHKTALLLLSLAGVSAAAGYVIGGVAGVVLAALITSAYVLVRVSLPPHFVMRLHRARPLDPWSSPTLYRMATRLARRARVATPQLYLIHAEESNAMSTGGPENGAVAVTTGLLRLLRPAEVEGVLAHEIAHIRHEDVRLLDVTSGAASAVVLLLRVALWVTVLFTLLFGGSLWRVVQLAALAFTIPWVVGWIQSALSRTREHAADATAVRISGRARELASALIKLQRQRQRRYLPGILTGRAEEPPMLRSHPATGDRVRRLLALAPPPQPQYQPRYQLVPQPMMGRTQRKYTVSRAA